VEEDELKCERGRNKGRKQDEASDGRAVLAVDFFNDKDTTKSAVGQKSAFRNL
jgi:hypothetical protein